MKKALSLLIFSCSYVLVFGQTTNANERIIHEKILTADTLIRGIYMDFSEFQENNPTIRSDFRSDEKELPVNSIYNNMDIRRLRILNANNAFVPFDQKHWGICDGENVYINYRINYQEISIDGKYSSFSEAKNTNFGRHTQHIDHLLNVVNGDIIKVNVKSVKSILSKEHISLYHDFRKDRDKEMMIYTYISWLNQSYGYE